MFQIPPVQSSGPGRAAGALVVLAFAMPTAVFALDSEGIAPVEPEPLAQFGQALAPSGTRLAVASPTAAGGKGRVDVFECGAGCQHEAVIQPVDLVEGDRFGASLALGSDELFVSAYHLGTGRVYVYARVDQTWTLSQVLTPSAGEDEDRFGIALSLDGARLAVGASRGLDGGGGVYVFEKTAGTWAQAAAFNTGAGQDDDAFGHAVALQGDRLLVGAPWFDADGAGPGWGQGAVFFFERISASNWSQTQQLPTPVIANGRAFGYSVALQGDLALVGAPGADDDRGAVQAYLFDGASFGFEAELDAARDPGERAGMRLALHGGELLSAAPLFAQDCGLVRRFRRTGMTWNEVFMPTSRVAPSMGRGWALGFDGQTAWVGLPASSRNGIAQAGAAVALPVSEAVFADGLESLQDLCAPPT